LNVGVRVTNADRVVFPKAGITKGEVVAYYESVADRMLVHLAGRPLTLERYPRGLDAPGFMQKNAASHFPPSIERVELPKRNGTTTYPVVHQPGDIPYLANQGTITFHAWLSRIPDLDFPDRLVIDLDPSEGDVAQVRRAARIVRETFDEIELASTPVATGSKGYHVVAPITATVDAGRIAMAMHRLAVWLGATHPELLTSEFRKEQRRGRVFVDWLRNALGSTSVVPWSLRARPGAPAAVPLAWDEVDDVAPGDVGLRTIASRLDRPDPLAVLADSPADAELVIAALEQRLDEAGVEAEPFDRFRS
jgi:bifunctional non-homologous end joining protein LigD